jgi:hypothetical protein
VLDFGLWGLEQQLIMDVQQHVGTQLFAGQRAVGMRAIPRWIALLEADAQAGSGHDGGVDIRELTHPIQCFFMPGPMICRSLVTLSHCVSAAL